MNKYRKIKNEHTRLYFIRELMRLDFVNVLNKER